MVIWKLGVYNIHILYTQDYDVNIVILIIGMSVLTTDQKFRVGKILRWLYYQQDCIKLIKRDLHCYKMIMFGFHKQ